VQRRHYDQAQAQLQPSCGCPRTVYLSVVDLTLMYSIGLLLFVEKYFCHIYKQKRHEQQPSDKKIETHNYDIGNFYQLEHCDLNSIFFVSDKCTLLQLWLI
jgi:hypothetical protein